MNLHVHRRGLEASVLHLNLRLTTIHGFGKEFHILITFRKTGDTLQVISVTVEILHSGMLTSMMQLLFLFQLDSLFKKLRS